MASNLTVNDGNIEGLRSLQTQFNSNRQWIATSVQATQAKFKRYQEIQQNFPSIWAGNFPAITAIFWCKTNSILDDKECSAKCCIKLTPATIGSHYDEFLNARIQNFAKSIFYNTETRTYDSEDKVQAVEQFLMDNRNQVRSILDQIESGTFDATATQLITTFDDEEEEEFRTPDGGSPTPPSNPLPGDPPLTSSSSSSSPASKDKSKSYLESIGGFVKGLFSGMGSVVRWFLSWFGLGGK